MYKCISYDLDKSNTATFSSIRALRTAESVGLINNLRRFLISKLAVRRIRGVSINKSSNYFENYNTLSEETLTIVERLKTLRIVDGDEKVISFTTDKVGTVSASDIFGEEIYSSDADKVLFTIVKKSKFTLHFDLSNSISAFGGSENVYINDGISYVIINRNFSPVISCSILESSKGDTLTLLTKTMERIDHSKMYKDTIRMMIDGINEFSNNTDWNYSIKDDTRIDQLNLPEQAELVLKRNKIINLSQLRDSLNSVSDMLHTEGLEILNKIFQKEQ